MSKLRFVGLDVHAETIAVAVAEADREARAGESASGLLRGRADGIRSLLAVGGVRRGV